ncbi:hypothetical protein SLS62_002169 [Diatrype stigma]|uniref:DUF6594 domain-containing protein n=1 Tax=Diatrype stigma TaxID=117547 RepID=A0AAN9YV87_9PEZI
MAPVSTPAEFPRSSSITETELSTIAADETDIEPTEQEVQRKPWKYVGYKRYAEFISSDDDFFILRRFGSLNVRVALLLQDQISVLEEQLDELDRRHSRRDAVDVNNGSFRNEPIEGRESLLAQIAESLSRYNELVLQQSKLRKYPQAPKRDVKSINNWHFNHDYRAIDGDEQKYLEHTDDLICVVQKDKTPLRKAIDNSLRLRTLPLWRYKKDTPMPEYDAAHLVYFKDERMDRFASVLIVSVGMVMLVTPLWILQSMAVLDMKLVVITVFVSVFLLVSSYFMAAKPFEALGATAA